MVILGEFVGDGRGLVIWSILLVVRVSIVIIVIGIVVVEVVVVIVIIEVVVIVIIEVVVIVVIESATAGHLQPQICIGCAEPEGTRLP